MKVENIAPNAQVVTNNGTRTLFSYGVAIAEKTFGGSVNVDPKYWNYSKTTSKHRAIFLGETIKETMKKIESEMYHFCNLNQ